MTRTLRTILVLLVGLAAVSVLVWFFVLPRFRPHVFHGQVIQSSQPAPPFELDGPNGTTVRLSDFEGMAVVLFFGYTHCPDVCPISLAKIDRALEMVGEKAKDVQVIMVSVDPERDTPEVLEEYVAHFDPTFIGVTGDANTINRVATTYGIFYEAEEGSEATGYLITHTATIMVVDQDGYLKLVLPYKGTAAEIADDLAYLLG